MQIELDNYEAANLKWALEVLRKLHLDTGDWLGQILFKLKDLGEVGEPNWPKSLTDEHVDQLMGKYDK